MTDNVSRRVRRCENNPQGLPHARRCVTADLSVPIAIAWDTRMGPYVNGSRVAGFTPCLVRGENPAGYVAGYSPGRWVWWNAAAKSRVLRLEALPRSLPLGSQSCLFCVSRTHPV
jgi:hypothetical protein